MNKLQKETLLALEAYNRALLVTHVTHETLNNYESFKEFIASHKNFTSRELLEGHVTASAFLFNNDLQKTLPTHHKKLGRWLQLGGHIEEGDTSILDGTLRELTEESGLTEIKPLFPYPVSLDKHLIPAKGTTPEHYHYDIRFACMVYGDETITISDESNDLTWIAVDDIAEVTNLENIINPIEVIKKLIANELRYPHATR